MYRLLFLSILLVFAGTVVTAADSPVTAPRQAIATEKSPMRYARIFDGEEASIEDNPWQVALLADNSCARGDRYCDDSYFYRQFCGGTIIDERWIITAAHCLAGDPVSVLAGESDLYGNGGQEVAIYDTYPHPDYDPVTFENDIALLELITPLDLSTDSARAVNIMTPRSAARGFQEPGVEARISGWGNLYSSGSSFPSRLRQAVVPILADDDPLIFWPDDYSNSRTLFAGFVDGGSDTCEGDSGGPLVVPDQAAAEGFRLAGVTSWGGSCGTPGYPGGYTKVSQFESWIEGYVGPIAEPAEEQVQLMYIAYYGRPGDPAGVNYWSERLEAAGGTWDARLIEAFGASPEFGQRFGNTAPETLIDNSFLNLFNRPADALGASYYLDLYFGSNLTGFNPRMRQLTSAQIPLDIIHGVAPGSSDGHVLAARLDVAVALTRTVEFSERPFGSTQIATAADIIAQVDGTVESIDLAHDQIRSLFGGG